MSDLFTRAEDFIWKNARLLERHLFAYHFTGGSREAVLAALRGYQNKDGGFGHALEPDIRCPDSQPVPVQHALEWIDSVGFDVEMARRGCDFLQSITTEEGGVPFVLPSVRDYPHAPWWHTEDSPPASLNPTAAIAGLLHKNGFQHPWLERATAFCWEQIPRSTLESEYDLRVILTFLEHVPDRQRAATEGERVGEHLRQTEHAATPLTFAPKPESYGRRFFDRAVVDAALDTLAAGQQADGGWTIAWPPISAGCELEWRGWVTLDALLKLKWNGRL